MAPGANPDVKLYSDPGDPTAAEDPACGCRGPSCKPKPTFCACQPEGEGTCTGTIGSYDISYPNGVKASYSGLNVAFSKSGVACCTAESSIPTRTEWSLTFRDPEGGLMGVAHMNPMVPGRGTFDCDGKSYEVEWSDPGCQEMFFPDMATACPVPGR